MAKSNRRCKLDRAKRQAGQSQQHAEARRRQDRYQRIEKAERPCLGACCGPQERAALSRFTDRSGMTALSDALSEFLAASEYGRAVDDHVAEHLEGFDDVDWEPGDLAEFRALLAEHALLSAEPEGVAPEPEDDQEEEATGPLKAFAADPSTPRDLAARSDAWRSHMHYGLWQVESGPAAPGLWCTGTRCV